MATKIPTVSLTAIAAELGVTTRTIRNYVRDGMPHRRNGAGDPSFVARECQRWYREREVASAIEKERARLDGQNLDKDKEQAEKLRVERQIKELELAKLRGQLVPVAEYQDRAEAFVGGFAAVAAGQLHRFERDIVKVATPAEARRLTDRVHAALMHGAQEYADTIEAEVAATSVEEAA
jgi:hypothetical protein